MALKKKTEETEVKDPVEPTGEAVQATEAPQPSPETQAPEVIAAAQAAAEEATKPGPTPEEVAAQADQAARDQAEARGKDPEAVPTHVKVRNLRKVARRQPRTGIWVGENEEAWLLNDGWLENQLRAKLLERVE